VGAAARGQHGEPMKVCSRCGLEKPEKSFGWARGRPEQRPYRRSTCNRCNIGKPPRKTEPPKRFARPLEGRRFIITAAQNATPVHPEFWKSLEVAAKHLGAELVVIPLRYRNPTSVWSKDQEDHEWWAEEVTPYLFNVRKKLNANLVIAGDVKTQPTASSPLSGFESLTGAESCILGHTKMQFRSVPVPTGRFPKLLTTTGACTKPNFTDSKAGKLGHFHHFLGALLVEIDGRRFHLRQLNADRKSGEFTDLDLSFSPRGVKKAPPALGLVLGDAHARFIDPAVDKATFGPRGIVETLQPRTLVFHDVFDGYSVNPHHLGNPFIGQAKLRGQVGDVREEVEHCVAWVKDRAKGRRAIIVSSNHDNFLSRWVANTDWRHTPGNAAFYLETAAAMLKSVALGPQGASYADPFVYWVEKLRGEANIRCLALDESFKLEGIECSLHGHQGPNGARGTLKNLSRLGARVISGHSHTPGIEEGHYQAGTSTPLRLEYAHGPSSWLNSHVIVYHSGKRALLTIIEGEWRLRDRARVPMSAPRGRRVSSGRQV
jgi:hypothetical protein